MVFSISSRQATSYHVPVALHPCPGTNSLDGFKSDCGGTTVLDPAAPADDIPRGFHSAAFSDRPAPKLEVKSSIRQGQVLLSVRWLSMVEE